MPLTKAKIADLRQTAEYARNHGGVVYISAGDLLALLPAETETVAEHGDVIAEAAAPVEAAKDAPAVDGEADEQPANPPVIN